jgi:PIN domain nuclease of toxin-antitoxin system
MTVVLDASALLAFLHDEPGGSEVAAVLQGSLVSTVNWAEVVQKALAHGVDIAGMQTDFSDIGVTFVPFSTNQAELAAGIWSGNRTAGLSLADRACLALALDRQAPALTADRAWRDLSLGIDVHVLR